MRLSHCFASHRPATPTGEKRPCFGAFRTSSIGKTGQQPRWVVTPFRCADSPKKPRVWGLYGVTPRVKRGEKLNTQEHKNTLRTSIYTDEEALTRCRVLFGEAGVTSFSQFVKKAIDCYIERLVAENHSAFLAKEIRQAVRNELRPITARLSKGLYRYAVLLDMLCQIIAYKDTDWSSDDLEFLRVQANVRTAKNRGNIDLKTLLSDPIDNTFYELEDTE